MTISVIVLSYDSRGDLERCLESLEAQSRLAEQVVVVDNGSRDGSAALVAQRFPRLELLALDQNLGFCRANNLALERCRGEIVALLNADVELDADFLAQAAAAFERHPEVGLVCAKLLRADRRTLDSAGQYWGRDRRVRERGYGEPDRGQFERPEKVPSCCGAAALYRRAMIDAIAPAGELFDETFFAFCEDLDVGLRAARAGWSALYWPRAVAYHRRGGTQHGRPRYQLLGRPAEIRYHILKNRYLLLLKHGKPGALLRDLPFIVFTELALWGVLLLTSPGVLWRLISDPRPFRRAWAQRSDD
ncbi:MAG TPA: glycosyltransferase family 2 protein [Acidobacteriota bacterium]